MVDILSTVMGADSAAIVQSNTQSRCSAQCDLIAEYSISTLSKDTILVKQKGTQTSREPFCDEQDATRDGRVHSERDGQRRRGDVREPGAARAGRDATRVITGRRRLRQAATGRLGGEGALGGGTLG